MSVSAYAYLIDGVKVQQTIEQRKFMKFHPDTGLPIAKTISESVYTIGNKRFNATDMALFESSLPEGFVIVRLNPDSDMYLGIVIARTDDIMSNADAEKVEGMTEAANDFVGFCHSQGIVVQVGYFLVPSVSY